MLLGKIMERIEQNKEKMEKGEKKQQSDRFYFG